MGNTFSVGGERLTTESSALANELAKARAEAAEGSLDKRKRRKSSPAASVLYSHKIHNISDPDGAKEAEINRLAKRMARLDETKDRARKITLRERLITKCMKFFYITGQDVDVQEGIGLHAGHFAQVDEIFIDTLEKVLADYDPAKGTFTHMLRNKYGFKRTDAAYSAALEDTRYGGGNAKSPISLNSTPYHDEDDSSKSFLDTLKRQSDDDLGEYEDIFQDDMLSESEGAEGASSTTALEMLDEEGDIGMIEEEDLLLRTHNAAEENVLMQMLSLITAFFGKTGKAANETRKLYTKLFFTETLTRITKTRTAGELESLVKQERSLFDTAELPFQDSYTIEECRTILELWNVAFIDGVRPLAPVYRRAVDEIDADPNYGWTLPAAVYITYLKGLGLSASNALVSQQRKNYDQLIKQLAPANRS